MLLPTTENVSVLSKKEKFFCTSKEFYKSFFHMLIIIALQNIVTYSVNIADNIMLGAYNQTALSGVAAVNQIQFMLQQFTMAGLGEGLVILAGHYRGKNNTKAVEQLIGLALSCGVAAAALLTAAAFIAPEKLVSIFSNDTRVLGKAKEYLTIIRFTYIPFVISSILLVSLRGMQVVKIAFKVSCMALIVNVAINYTLIFGNFGAPELGVRGAAIGTLVARFAEFICVLLYCGKKSLPVQYRLNKLFKFDIALFKDYLRVCIPCVVSALLFSSAVAVQTIIFGHISQDAMAAASASGALFQYCKMIPVSAAAAASVWMAKAVGSGEKVHLRSYVRTLQVLFFGIGILIFVIMLAARTPVLSLYSITPKAKEFAMQMLFVQAVASLGMSYQMPCQLGIIRAGGDTRYSMISDLIYSWGLVVPLGLLAAFVFKWPFVIIAACLNCDQIIKCITVYYKTNKYTWIKKLAK